MSPKSLINSEFAREVNQTHKSIFSSSNALTMKKTNKIVKKSTVDPLDREGISVLYQRNCVCVFFCFYCYWNCVTDLSIWAMIIFFLLWSYLEILNKKRWQSNAIQFFLFEKRVNGIQVGKMFLWIRWINKMKPQVYNENKEKNVSWSVIMFFFFNNMYYAEFESLINT